MCVDAQAYTHTHTEATLEYGQGSIRWRRRVIEGRHQQQQAYFLEYWNAFCQFSHDGSLYSCVHVSKVSETLEHFNSRFTCAAFGRFEFILFLTLFPYILLKESTYTKASATIAAVLVCVCVLM